MKNIKSPEEQTKIEYFSFILTSAILPTIFLIRKTFPEHFMIRFKEEASLCYIAMVALLMLGYWIKHKIALFTITAMISVLFFLMTFFLQGYLPALRVILFIFFILHAIVKYPPPLSYALGGLSIVLSLMYFGIPVNWSKSLLILIINSLFFTILTLYLVNREESVHKEHIIQQQRDSVKQLTSANHQFLEYLENVEIESAERERNRITRELHDSIGYALTNVSAMMETIPYLYENDPEKMFDFCQKTQDLSNSVMQEVRSTLYILRSIKKQKNYNPSFFFFDFCKEFSKATGIKTEFHPLLLSPSFDEYIFKVIHRAVQVGFINALRHAHADHIKVFLHQTDDEIELIIWNNLNNHYHTPDSEQRKGIGLKGIDERLIPLGGKSILRYVKDGFELVISIPLKEE